MNFELLKYFNLFLFSYPRSKPLEPFCLSIFVYRIFLTKSAPLPRPYSSCNRPGFLWHSVSLDPKYEVKSAKYYTGICDKVLVLTPVLLILMDFFAVQMLLSIWIFACLC